MSRSGKHGHEELISSTAELAKSRTAAARVIETPLMKDSLGAKEY
ncbi:hypothetical protein DET50_12066 [Marinobacter pelagius]|uniref:Uncharacterized protein n=1 Tax=Marinobacter pelagius TaxID=379482 RepID=A0A366GJB6_9GAMM|nr:hypothetical protein DET50_12066 [Marinobacter pelagius]